MRMALKRIKGQQGRFIDDYKNGAIEQPQFKAEMEKLRDQQRNMERQLAEIEARAVQQSREADAPATLEAFCDGLGQGIENLTFEEKQELLLLVGMQAG